MTAFVLLMSSCARVPVYGSGASRTAGCEIVNDRAVCYPTPSTFDANHLFEMSPIEKLGMPSPPSLD